VPWGINRRHVITLQDGESGEKSLSVACSTARMLHVRRLPGDCFYTTPDGIVLHDKISVSDAAIAFMRVPSVRLNFRAEFLRRPRQMTNDFCAGGPGEARGEYRVRPQPVAEGKLPFAPRCAPQGPARRRW